MEELPQNLSGPTHETLRHAVKAEKRLTRLFRRWPSLSPLEMEELRQLYQERVRVAKQLGRSRSARKSAGKEDG